MPQIQLIPMKVIMTAGTQAFLTVKGNCIHDVKWRF